MLKYRILAYEVNNLTDARYFAAWYADWVSFHMEDLKPGNDLSKIKAILEWIDGPKFAIRPTEADPDFCFQMYKQLNLEAIHLSISENKDTLSAFIDIPIVAELSSAPDLTRLKSLNVKAIILSQTTYESIISSIKQLFPETEVFIKAESDISIPNEKEQAYHSFGFAVKGGDEERPGYKSFDELDAFFETIEKEA